MSKSSWWTSFQVGCTYIGTVVGAGFASGQEIYQFFGKNGNWGFIGVILATILFAWLGYQVMMLGSRLQAPSLRFVNIHLFGSGAGKWIDAAVTLMLFGVTVAMLAGAGELFRERANIAFEWGAALTIVVTFLTILRGMEGILKANTVIVPTMVAFVLFAAWHTWHHLGIFPALQTGAAMTHGGPTLSVAASVVYGALNIGLSAGVLVPLGNTVRNPAELRRGAVFGALGLGGMMIAVMFCLFSFHQQVSDLQIPMAFVASQLGHFLQWAFLFVLWGEIYSTLVGNVFAITQQLSPTSYRQSLGISALILVLAFSLSQIGFSTIVKYGYTLFGWMSIVLLFALLWPRSQR